MSSPPLKIAPLGDIAPASWREIAAGLRLFMEPGQVTETRFLGVVEDPKYGSSTHSGFWDFDHADAAAKVIAAWSPKAEGSYFVFNPIDPELLSLRCNRIARLGKKEEGSTTQDKHILKRVRFVIDSDPTRLSVTTGEPLPPKIPSTDEEKARAKDRIDGVRDHLLNRHKWAGLTLCDSGNGYHQWAEVDLPRDDDVIERALKSLNRKFGDRFVSIDTSVFNPSRIIKVYGSAARKGENLANRPHRIARILIRPAQRVVIDQGQLEAVAAESPPPKTIPMSPVPSPKPRTPTSEAFIVERARKCIMEGPDSVEGEHGHNPLFGAATALIDGFGLDRATARTLLVEYNNLKAHPPESDFQIDHKLDDAIKKCPIPSLRLLNAPMKAPMKAPWPNVRPTSYPGPQKGDPAQTHEPPPEPKPTVDPASLKARVEKAIEAGWSGLYGDKGLIADLAVLENEDSGQFACIQNDLRGRKAGGQKFAAADFNMVLKDHREHFKKAKKARDKITPEMENEYEFTDLGNAHRFADLCKGMVHYLPPQKFWMTYDGKRWFEDIGLAVEEIAKHVHGQIICEMPPTNDEAVIDAFRQWAQFSQSSKAIFDLLKLGRSEPGIPIGLDKFDVDPMLLNVQNGTVDLRTGKLRPHDPRDKISKIARVRHDRNATCPKWLEHIRRASGGSTDLMGYLKRVGGYGATGDVGEHCVFLLHGDGRNGKSTYLNTIQHLLGDYATTIDPELLIAKKQSEHPTGLCDLQGARFVPTIETDEGKRLAEALIKRLSGGDKLKARRMNENFREFDPTFKLMIAANHELDIRGTDAGIWSRIRKIPFTVEIPVGERIKNYHEILVREEGPGILNWIIEGCLEWQEGGLREPGEVVNATKEYRESMDRLQDFVNERCATGPDLRVGSTELYKAYKEWSEDNSIHPMTSPKFYSAMSKKGFENQHTNLGNFRRGISLAKPAVVAWLREKIAHSEMKIGDVLSLAEEEGVTKSDIFAATKAARLQTRTLGVTKYWYIEPSESAAAPPPSVSPELPGDGPIYDDSNDTASALRAIDQDDYTRRDW